MNNANKLGCIYGVTTINYEYTTLIYEFYLDVKMHRGNKQN